MPTEATEEKGGDGDKAAGLRDTVPQKRAGDPQGQMPGSFLHSLYSPHSDESPVDLNLAQRPAGEWSQKELADNCPDSRSLVQFSTVTTACALGPH